MSTYSGGIEAEENVHTDREVQREIHENKVWTICENNTCYWTKIVQFTL